jgi:hypothetical protein
MREQVMSETINTAEEEILGILLTSTPVARSNHLRRLREWHTAVTEHAMSEADRGRGDRGKVQSGGADRPDSSDE